MDLKEYNRICGNTAKVVPANQRSKRTKQSILTLNTSDQFLNSDSSFELDIPIHINHKGRDFYIYKGTRKGVSYQISYGTCPSLITKKAIRSSQIHSSFFSIVKTLGLSYAAKEIYKLLGSYDLHVSGQANLTTLRWNQAKQPNNEICISHEGNKDLIFSGRFVAGINIGDTKKYDLFGIDDKCPYSFVITETLESPMYLVSSYMLGRNIEDAIGQYGRDVEKHFLELI